MDKKEKFLKLIINKMLEKHNVDFDYVKDNPEIENKPWYQYFTQTEEEHTLLKQMFIKEAKKTFKWNEKLAESEWSWFDLMWGVKVVN